MDPALASLLAASVAFVGSHFAMSHPFRAPMVRALGEKGFLGVYTLVSLGTFAWMVIAFRAAPVGGTPLWSGYDEVSWFLASVLTLIATVLFLGSLRGNPALPGTAHDSPMLAAEARGVYRVTRHPMMWGFALWAIAHIAVAPTTRTLILAGAILILALVGAHLQDRKKAMLMGDGWAHWQGQTRYFLRWTSLPRAGAVLWLVSIALWLLMTWAHVWIAYIPAGIWRWF